MRHSTLLDQVFVVQPGFFESVTFQTCESVFVNAATIPLEFCFFDLVRFFSVLIFMLYQLKTVGNNAGSEHWWLLPRLYWTPWGWTRWLHRSWWTLVYRVTHQIMFWFDLYAYHSFHTAQQIFTCWGHNLCPLRTWEDGTKTGETLLVRVILLCYGLYVVWYVVLGPDQRVVSEGQFVLYEVDMY